MEKEYKEEKDRELLKKLGCSIRKIRNSKKITQEDLAGNAGISVQSISSYETGVNVPSIASAKAIADALDVTVNDLLEEDENNLRVLKMEDEPLLAFVTAMRILRFRVSLTENNEIILVPAEDSINYSKSYLMEFIQKYIEITEKFDDNDDYDELYSAVKKSKIEELVVNYSFLPGFPE